MLKNLSYFLESILAPFIIGVASAFFMIWYHWFFIGALSILLTILFAKSAVDNKYSKVFTPIIYGTLFFVGEWLLFSVSPDSLLLEYNKVLFLIVGHAIFILFVFIVTQTIVSPKKTQNDNEINISPEEKAAEMMRKIPYTMEKGENNTIIVKAKMDPDLTEEEKIQFEKDHNTVIIHCFTEEQINRFRKIDEELRKQRDAEDKELRESITFGNNSARKLFMFIIEALDEQDSSSRAVKLLQAQIEKGKLINDDESLNEIFIKIIQSLDEKIRLDEKRWKDYFNKKNEIFEKYLGDDFKKYKDMPVIISPERT